MSERKEEKPQTQWQPTYIDVRYPDGRLAFRYDPQRGVVELQKRGEKHYFDLTMVKQ